MPRLLIDGKAAEVPEGTNLIEAARSIGIAIPHYCYHPRLSIDGNCRMCLVEVEGTAKLPIACNTMAREGMVVRTTSPVVIEARQGVLEFFLLNHPLDCPICDQSGECPLQDYSYTYGAGESRFVEEKVTKSKRVPIGPRVVLDTERCILCTRCIRFCEEIAGEHTLGLFHRTNHTELGCYPGTEMANAYSMCTIDICPVGALTSRDFRFKARVWDMDSVATICPLCANGCNILIETKGNRIMRLRPRTNEAVNQDWMCDEGRLGYGWIEGPDRLTHPLVRREGVLVPVSWTEALEEAARLLRRVRERHKASAIAGIASPQLTNEDLWAFRRLVRDGLGSPHLGFRPNIKPGQGDDFLIKEDKAPNTRGARDLGIGPAPGGRDCGGILEGVRAGSIRGLYCAGEELLPEEGDPVLEEALGRLEALVVQEIALTRTARRAQVVLPALCYAEKAGTFTNCTGRVQRIRPAIATPDGPPVERVKTSTLTFRTPPVVRETDARPDWEICRDLARALGRDLPYASIEEVFEEIARKVPAYKGLTYARLGYEGVAVGEAAERAAGRTASR